MAANDRRTAYRAVLGAGCALGALFSVAGLITRLDPLNDLGWTLAVGASILYLLSLQRQTRELIAELQRRDDGHWKRDNALLARVVDLMDSAKRTDPVYAAREIARKQQEQKLREQGIEVD